MRKVLSTDNVAHYWANKLQAEGRNCPRNFYFEGDTIYSYGRHFPIARHLPDGSVAITTKKYSNTTNKHTWLVRHAVAHLRVIDVDDPTASPLNARANALLEIENLLRLAATPQNIRQHTRDTFVLRAVDVLNNFNAYLEAVAYPNSIAADNDIRIGTDVIPTDLTALREREKAREEEEDARRIERDKRRAIEQAEHREEWRNGTRHGYFTNPTMLRIGLDHDGNGVVETSQGAEVPIEDAIKLFHIVERVRKGTKDYEPGMQVGKYRLNQIKQDGTIIVGCHTIHYDEIEAIARQLSLIPQTT